MASKSKGASSSEAKILKTMGLRCVLPLDSSSSSAIPISIFSTKTSILPTSSVAFKGASSSSSSTSSSSITDGAYDVFLSFRGSDTRNNFIAHLDPALRQKGIKTYLDNNDLERGENISSALLKAIEESRISVIVLSQNYASSSWCLDELTKILECKETKGQIVLPLFYKVDPSEVRYQNKSFEKAFIKHEERFKYDPKKMQEVQRWKTALTQVANLSGRNLEEGRNEYDFIQKEIIEWVNSKLLKETSFQLPEYSVGIVSLVQAEKWHLDRKKKDGTRMVGIFGIGGIGKTTLAKVIYNSIASQFEGRCFLENVRETSDQKDGLIHLQNKLLSKILEGSSQMVDDSVEQGVTLIKKRLHFKRIFLVLDDVDKLDQLEKLAGNTDWFGFGSIIIITTRNKHLLHDRVESIYPMKGLDHDEALRLFSWHAFKSDKPNDDYVEVTKDAIGYCGGLPLALTVLGSALKGRSIHYWKCKLDEYKRFPNRDIQKILKISFDGLEENAKKIFLDIACFFKGDDVKYVRKMLDGCGFHSITGIEELKDRCLIIEDRQGSLTMHDLLQEMGREIVRQESEEPGKRSRLWFHEDVRSVLEGNTGTNKVEGILIDLPDPDPIELSPETFKKMKRLRLFISRNARFSEVPNIHSNELRVIDCAEYPGEYFPSNNFRGKKLVILRMARSCIKILEGVQHFSNLTTMDFYECKFLEKIPDVSSIPKLVSLKLVKCENLVEVHESVGFLDHLVELIIEVCSNLKSFPKIFKLGSLKYLEFRDCLMLKNFPEIERPMECLEDIKISNIGIKELPSSFGYLVGLKILSLNNCNNPWNLPESMTHLPDSIIQLQHLEQLNLSSSGIVTLPQCIESSGGLKFLNLRNLVLSSTAIVSIPTWFNRFVRLETLDLRWCNQLREILGLPPNVRVVNAWGCSSLEVFLEEPRRSELFNTCVPLDPLRVGMVPPALLPLERKFQLECPFNNLAFLDLGGSAIVSLPTFFNIFVRLSSLHLECCKQFREVPELPRNIKFVNLGGCTSLERLPFNNIYDLPELYWIDFSDCPEQIGNDLQNHLFSEGHPKLRDFDCIYPGNRIPDCVSYCKEVSNTHLCEIDTGPLHFDSKNARFSFFAVIGPRDDFGIVVKVIDINGQLIYSDFSDLSTETCQSARSNRVWLHYTHSYHSQLRTDNLQVKFEIKDYDDDDYGDDDESDRNPIKQRYDDDDDERHSLQFFKSCGFHIIE